MREIKFRAWDREFKKMYDLEKCIDFEISDLSNRRLQHNSLEPMQYTGLRDKNNKRIYDGDIVLKKSNKKPINDFSDNKPFLVHWNAYNCGWNIRQPVAHKKTGVLPHTYEILGNIYENKELLSKKEVKYD